MTGTSRGAILRRAIETCIRPDDDAIAKLGELFHDDVTVWSPNLFAVGLADLAKNLEFRENAFSDVDIQIDALDVFANKGFAETAGCLTRWRPRRVRCPARSSPDWGRRSRR